MKNLNFTFSNNDELIAYLEKINHKKVPLTIERLRSYPGCEKYTEEEAEDIIQLLNELARIILEHVAYKNSICVDNQYIVYLNPETSAKQISINNEAKNVAA